jgi:two-component system, NtrC family, response regulator AtoC
MSYATTKIIESPTVRSTLTPCIFDDNPAERDSLNALISDMGYEPVCTSDPEEAPRLIRLGRCRLVFASIHLEANDPYEFLARALRCDPGIHVILMTAEYTLEGALEAIRRGAADFLPKPIDHIRLKRTLDDVACLHDQRRRVRALEEQLLKDLEFHGIIGKSPPMLEVFDFARKVARRYTNVLLVGPTGVGKELVRVRGQVAGFHGGWVLAAVAARWERDLFYFTRQQNHGRRRES